MEALKARRYYASQDCNVRIDYKNGNSPMGSIVTKGGRPSLTLTVTDPDAETVNTIQLWGGAIGSAEPTTPLHTYNNVSSFNFTSGDAWNTQSNNTSWYYFAIITQADGNKIVTAPIWYTRSDVALPVTLTKFEGVWADTKTRTNLTWSTARELNSKSFIVQRSTDKGQSWQDIAEVYAGGTTTGDKYYQYADLRPGLVNWYRLKMVDIDGDYTYSRVVILSKNENAELSYTIYPNPASSFVKVQSKNTIPEKLNVRVTDLNGRVIHQQTATASNSTPATIGISGLANGIYLLWVNGVSHKLIVGQ
jgi:hypothetical protein